MIHLELFHVQPIINKITTGEFIYLRLLIQAFKGLQIMVLALSILGFLLSIWMKLLYYL